MYFSDELPQDIDLANVVKRMLNIYLCSINASSYGFEDTFSDSYIYMKRALAVPANRKRLFGEQFLNTYRYRERTFREHYKI